MKCPKCKKQMVDITLNKEDWGGFEVETCQNKACLFYGIKRYTHREE
jgi:hypothetical protein